MKRAVATYVLVDQDDANVLALGRKALKRRLDGRSVGLAVDDEEVLLLVRTSAHMLYLKLGTIIGRRIRPRNVRRCLRGAAR